jgi:acetyl esterase/lipase
MMAARRSVLKFLAVAPLALLPAACSTLSAFDTLVPKDGGTKLAAREIAYGPEPRQKLDVYVPVGSDPLGVLVFVYGGSWSNGSKADYGFAGRAFAARGYVTVIFDYRLVPDVRYPAFVEDTAKAVAWTRRNASRYGADPAKLYLAGHSAGAYNAMMVALAPEFLRAEGFSTSTVRAAAGLSGPYDFLPLAVDSTQAAFSGVGALERTQPVNRAMTARPTPPILLATGDADTTVLPRNTRRLAAVLRRAGHTVEDKYYPGVDHSGTVLPLSRPLRGKAPVLDDLLDFFARH